MGTTAWLQQISTNGLLRMKQEPRIFEEIIMHISLGENIKRIRRLDELNSDETAVLGEITDRPESILECWTVEDVESIDYLREISPDLYERVKPELYTIIMDEKDCLKLDLNLSWNHVDSLLRASETMESHIAICSEGRLKVNIFSGDPVNPKDKYPCQRYQEPKQVSELAFALSEIIEENIHSRFKQALLDKPPVYRYGWREEDYGVLLQYIEKVKYLYQQSATHGFGIVHAVG